MEIKIPEPKNKSKEVNNKILKEVMIKMDI
jgi:hypothetical protein